MPLATKNGAIIVKDGKLAENCGCCGCPQNCACGCSCDSPMPPQVKITLSEIPDALFEYPVRCYRFFNRSYTLCTNAASQDLSPSFCPPTNLSYCKQLAGLCSRMIQYSWQGIDTTTYFSAIGNAEYDSCAAASVAFGTPASATSACLQEFAFAATNLNNSLTLRGLFTKSIDGSGAAVYTPASLSGQCGDLSFDGYSQVWVAPGLLKLYYYNQKGMRKADDSLFNRAQPLGIYARVQIVGSQSCESDRVVTGEPVFKTVNSFAVNGDGFSTTTFSRTITATVSVSKFEWNAFSYALAGNNNCAFCTDGHTEKPPQTTRWTIYRRQRGDPSKCVSAFSDPNPGVPESVAGSPTPSVASVYFISGATGCETTQWAWNLRALAPTFTFPKGRMCKQVDPARQECPEQDITIAPEFGNIGIFAITPAGQLPRDFYYSQWISLSGGGAGQVTQSVDGLEPAPKFTYQGIEYTMKLGYRYKVTFS